MNVTPHSVSGRVVKHGIGSPVWATRKFTSAPSLRPIQFACISRTRSGQASSSFRSSSNGCAYSVILKNHCGRSFWVTGVSQRSQRPFTTSSFASPVWQLGHQFTGASRR